jgi:hypothetical protein
MVSCDDVEEALDSPRDGARCSGGTGGAPRRFPLAIEWSITKSRLVKANAALKEACHASGKDEDGHMVLVGSEGRSPDLRWLAMTRGRWTDSLFSGKDDME